MDSGTSFEFTRGLKRIGDLTDYEVICIRQHKKKIYL